AMPLIPGMKMKQGAAILLWDLAGNHEKMILKDKEGMGMVTCLAWAPDGKTLASVSFDKNINLWDMDTGKLRATLRVHGLIVTSLVYDADGGTVATGCVDGIIKLWDTKTSQVQSNLKGHLSEVTAMVFSPDSKRLISLGSDDVVKVWDPTASQGQMAV